MCMSMKIDWHSVFTGLIAHYTLMIGVMGRMAFRVYGGDLALHS